METQICAFHLGERQAHQQQIVAETELILSSSLVYWWRPQTPAIAFSGEETPGEETPGGERKAFQSQLSHMAALAGLAVCSEGGGKSRLTWPIRERRT